mmetsp:Transcript_2278/g.6475  ORF Transcript_2278/g.6475 Transcript_2278/m.6475 type:complete len:88 (-) Transcript_2278:1029-1292(-)
MLSIAVSSLSFNAPALAPRTAPSAASVRMGVADMEGVGPETGNKVFDPLGLAKIASPETLAWYRAAELKHSRVAMVRSAIDALDISA